MKEFIEKLIERLEKLKESGNPYDSYWDETMYRATELVNSTSNKTIDGVIEIVNQLAEEYNNDFCEWKKISVGGITAVKEPHRMKLLNCDHEQKFCPYCGKKIKVVE